jgi:hypothetical protein
LEPKKEKRKSFYFDWNTTTLAMNHDVFFNLKTSCGGNIIV